LATVCGKALKSSFEEGRSSCISQTVGVTRRETCYLTENCINFSR
jgi:hypothetical protein